MNARPMICPADECWAMIAQAMIVQVVIAYPMNAGPMIARPTNAQAMIAQRSPVKPMNGQTMNAGLRRASRDLPKAAGGLPNHLLFGGWEFKSRPARTQLSPVDHCHARHAACASGAIAQCCNPLFSLNFRHSGGRNACGVEQRWRDVLELAVGSCADRIQRQWLSMPLLRNCPEPAPPDLAPLCFLSPAWPFSACHMRLTVHDVDWHDR